MSAPLIVFVLAIVIAIAAATKDSVSDSANDKFAQCCRRSGIPCVELCQHPPATSYNNDQRECLSQHMSDYIHCATAGNDNRRCCIDAGVSGSNGENNHCLDLCHDSRPQPLLKYASCAYVKVRIAKCNHDSNLSH